MKKLILAALLSSVSVAACAEETIRFATEASYPPFEFLGYDNTIQGFDVDLANGLCKEINVTCTFSHQAFDSLIPGLKFRRYEAVIAGMDITPERHQQVTFSQPYYNNSALFISQKGKVADIDALKGKLVGVQNGTTYQKYLMDLHTDMKTVSYDSYQNAILDLKSSRLDALFGDTAMVNEWLKQNDQLATVGSSVTDKNYFGIGLGIAVRQGNDGLVKRFNDSLDKVQKDGTYQSIYNKWFQK
ncbi:MAG: arginine ABC transporter substrate-binding protein [Candidatus Malihini olakiniferum]